MSAKDAAMQPEHIASPGDVLCDKYRIERVIGQGGMGIVMEAWHLQFDERVAIKFLSPALGADSQAHARFEREARVLFKIKSPHVCRVLDVGKLERPTSEGAKPRPPVPFLVMEFLEGEDLASRLTNREQSAVEDAVDYVVQACEAVGEAHARGIVHRDIKPENLFLARGADGAPCIKVLDFGLSKLTQSGDPNAPRQRSLTNTEQAMGTPHYMSPEQWLSARDVGPASDQWALAVILYELIAGVPPFEGEQLAHVCSQVLHGPMPSLVKRCPHVPAALEQAISRALEKDALARFGNLGQFAAAIAPFGRSESRGMADRIVRVFEQAEAMLASADISRASMMSGAFAALAPAPRPSTPMPQPGPSTAQAAPAATVAQQPMVPAQAITVPIPGQMGSVPQFPGPVQAAPTPMMTPRAQTAQSWQQPMVPTPVPAPPASRGGTAAALIVTGVLAAAGVGLFFYTRDHRDPRVAAAGAASADTSRPADSAPTAAASAPSSATSESAPPADASAASLASASASPSASAVRPAVSAKTPPRGWPPPPPPKAPPPTKTTKASAAPPPPPSKKPSIFDGR
jgi:eukaryotic-like serine/threonine-protein kinase